MTLEFRHMLILKLFGWLSPSENKIADRMVGMVRPPKKIALHTPYPFTTRKGTGVNHIAEVSKKVKKHRFWVMREREGGSCPYRNH